MRPEARIHLIAAALRTYRGQRADNGLGTGMSGLTSRPLLGHQDATPKNPLTSALIRSGSEMPSNYRFPLGEEPQTKLNVLRRNAAQKGVRFVGDVNSGSFSGMGLDGSYVREGSDIIVTINRVPFIYSFEQVASMIRKFLGE